MLTGVFDVKKSWSWNCAVLPWNTIGTLVQLPRDHSWRIYNKSIPDQKSQAIITLSLSSKTTKLKKSRAIITLSLSSKTAKLKNDINLYFWPSQLAGVFDVKTRDWACSWRGELTYQTKRNYIKLYKTNCNSLYATTNYKLYYTGLLDNVAILQALKLKNDMT